MHIPEDASREGNDSQDELLQEASVQLWIYDLSQGWAKWFARLLCPRTGIDGIWHTSIVVHDREIWFGDGITITTPGTCRLGPPHQVMALGTTQIDESTLEVFLEEVQKYYSAEQHHLLGFNCNSFTNLCAQFLTGSSIPDTISDLPIDFISSNLGWMANPIIQALYRRTTEPMQDHGGSRLSRALRSITRLSALSSGYTGQEIKSSTSTINTQDRPSTVDGQTLYIAILQRHTGRVLAVLTIPGSAVDSTP